MVLVFCSEISMGEKVCVDGLSLLPAGLTSFTVATEVREPRVSGPSSFTPPVRPRGLWSRVFTDRLSSSPEYTEMSAILRISLTDCLVLMETLSGWRLARLEKSDMMERSELGLTAADLAGTWGAAPGLVSAGS